MAYILIITLLLGLFMYLWAPPSRSNEKELGRLMFFAALLALLITLAPLTVALLR